MATEPTTERTDVIVIGAGQAGLSAGHHLARRGIAHVILDGNARVGDTWRTRWDSLRLYSPAIADGLPGTRFPAKRTAFPTGREMGDFLEAYAREWRLPVRGASKVERVRPRAGGRGGYVVETADRRFEADQVIVATGGFHTPYVPAFADRLDPSIRQLHSSEYRRPSQLADGPVLVVGASHSGADVALEAADSGHPTTLSGRIEAELPFPLESRRGRVVLPLMLLAARHVLTLATPIGRKMAPRVRQGGGPLLRVRRVDLDAAGVDRTEARTVDVRDGKPVLADGRVLDVATVVWCTGFRPSFSWIEGLTTDEQGWPVQRRGVVPDAPGLYFLGLPFLFAFASMLVAGAGRDAAYVVDRVAERIGRPAPVGERAAPAPAAAD